MGSVSWLKHDILFHLLFIAATPVSCYFVFALDKFDERALWGIVNSYVFSIGMVGLYVWPLISPFSPMKTWKERLHHATLNWVYLSVFTEVAFQVVHNLAPGFFYANRNTLVEWPFWTYGMSDDRWNNYYKGEGLEGVVQLINWNDAILGAIVGLAWLGSKTRRGWVLFVVLLVFRDATLWRETVEYMWDHHHHGYPHTIGHTACVHSANSEAGLRVHAIVCLWLVNVLWLIAPVTSVVWAVQRL
eukprot:Hpha_TRINITY_DN7728_c0_g1::TRINITY_DN7728_c0_g1_i1::g.85386::m.85386